jgi:hypothetical protein
MFSSSLPGWTAEILASVTIRATTFAAFAMAYPLLRLVLRATNDVWADIVALIKSIKLI